MKVEVGMVKPNDLDKYVSRLNEIMENSPPKISTSENLEVSPELKARIKKISLENSKVKKKGRIITFKKKAVIKLAAACIVLLFIVFPQQILGYARTVVNYIVNSFEMYSEISFTDSNKITDNNSLDVNYEFSYSVPSGYTVKEENKENGYFAVLENQNGSEIYITIENNDISQLKIDTENAAVDYINIDSTRVMQVYKNRGYTLFWADEQYNYEISSDSHLDILVDLAEKFIKK